MELVGGIVADFMNQVNAGDRFPFEKAVLSVRPAWAVRPLSSVLVW